MNLTIYHILRPDLYTFNIRGALCVSIQEETHRPVSLAWRHRHVSCLTNGWHSRGIWRTYVESQTACMWQTTCLPKKCITQVTVTSSIPVLSFRGVSLRLHTCALYLEETHGRLLYKFSSSRSDNKRASCRTHDKERDLITIKLDLGLFMMVVRTSIYAARNWGTDMYPSNTCTQHLSFQCRQRTTIYRDKCYV